MSDGRARSCTVVVPVNRISHLLDIIRANGTRTAGTL